MIDGGFLGGDTRVRWGFRQNNEWDFKTDDVLGGIGMYNLNSASGAVTHMSAGDSYYCCAVGYGARQRFSFLLYGCSTPAPLCPGNLDAPLFAWILDSVRHACFRCFS